VYRLAAAVRITGGQYGSRALKAPKGSLTRPTSDRVREALFSILGKRVAARKVLDLYAGTGALGLEALSRGAASVVFVERSKDALAALHANVEALGVRDVVRVLASTVDRAAARLEGERFDLVFADPPYADVKSGVVAKAIEELFVPLLSAEEGRAGEEEGEAALLVLEHASRDKPPTIAGLVEEDVRTYGDTTLSFYARARASVSES
jgi:16S rRNA (guanine966-N2)-methyltransferase